MTSHGVSNLDAVRVLMMEKRLSGHRVQWQCFADEGNDVLHAELKSLLTPALGGAEMPQETRSVVRAMQEAPLLATV